MHENHGGMIVRVAVALAAFLVRTLSSAQAQGPATIRGQVYSCATHRPVSAGVRVRLGGPDERTTTLLSVDRNGRFARVGVTPGRYLIAVIPTESTLVTRHPFIPLDEIAPLASRLARIESDDVLDVPIGIADAQRRAPLTGLALTPQPVCDAALVPPAPSTADRYVIH